MKTPDTQNYVVDMTDHQFARWLHSNKIDANMMYTIGNVNIYPKDSAKLKLTN